MGQYPIRCIGGFGNSSPSENTLGDHFPARGVGVDRKHFPSSGAIAGTGRKPCLLVAVDRTPVLRRHGHWASDVLKDCRNLVRVCFIVLDNSCNDARRSLDRLGFELLVRVCLWYRGIFVDYSNSHQTFHSMADCGVCFSGNALVILGTTRVDAAKWSLRSCDTHRILSSGHAGDDRPVPEGLSPVPNSIGSGTHGNWRDLLLALSDARAGWNTDF